MANLDGHVSNKNLKKKKKKKWCSVLVWTREILWGGGGSPNSTLKNMPYRLAKSRSALAEARLKTVIWRIYFYTFGQISVSEFKIHIVVLLTSGGWLIKHIRWRERAVGILLECSLVIYDD